MSQSKSPGVGGADGIMVGAILAIVGGGFVLGLVGQVAGLLFKGAWPDANFGDIFSSGLRVIINLGDASKAWPEASQSQVPGAGGYLFTLALFVALGVGAYFLGRRVWEDFFEGGKGALGQEESRWAKRKSLNQLIVPSNTKGRLTLGRAHGKLLAAEPRQSVIVLGPSQSGKTTGLAVPAILEWEGPVIATSVKSDLARDTLQYRERVGRVWVYDPTESTSLPKSTWSPLDGARDWQGAKRIASWLVGASQGDGKNGLQDSQFWYTAAGKLLAPHLFAAATNGYTMADVVRWIDTQEDFELRALLQASGVEEAILAAEAGWGREDRARSSIYTTAEVVIEAYSDPTVLQSARTSEIRTSKFLDGGSHTLYVCAPGHEQARLQPVFSTILKQFITAAYDKSLAQGGHPLDPPLLIVLDEAANIAPLKDLDALASTAAGYGVQLLTVWQDLAQINARYGDRAQTVVNNHRAKIVLSGISDTSTLDYASRLIGTEDVSQMSFTTDGSGSKSSTQSRQDKNLAAADVLRRIRQNEGVLVYGALLPSRLQLRPWYKSRELTAKATGQAVPTTRAHKSGSSGGGSAAPVPPHGVVGGPLRPSAKARRRHEAALAAQPPKPEVDDDVTEKRREPRRDKRPQAPAARGNDPFRDPFAMPGGRGGARPGYPGRSSRPNPFADPFANPYSGAGGSNPWADPFANPYRSGADPFANPFADPADPSSEPSPDPWATGDAPGRPDNPWAPPTTDESVGARSAKAQNFETGSDLDRYDPAIEDLFDFSNFADKSDEADENDDDEGKEEVASAPPRATPPPPPVPLPNTGTDDSRPGGNAQ